MKRVRPVAVISDENFMRHLEERHQKDLKLKFLPEPGRAERRLGNRSTWEVYHETVHRISIDPYDHCHGVEVGMAKGSGGEPLRYAGPPLIELLWDKMDRVTDKVMGGDKSDKTVGRALGISECLAVFTNPYNPNPKQIREEAKQRWNNRQE